MFRVHMYEITLPLCVSKKREQQELEKWEDLPLKLLTALLVNKEYQKDI